MLSAMRLDGVIEDATVRVDGAVHADAFLRDTEHCPAPSLRPGDVVGMNNRAAHLAAHLSAEKSQCRRSDPSRRRGVVVPARL